MTMEGRQREPADLKTEAEGSVNPIPGEMVTFTQPDTGQSFVVRYGGGTEVSSPDGRVWLVDPDTRQITGEKPKPE
jgi:hypothetical protein